MVYYVGTSCGTLSNHSQSYWHQFMCHCGKHFLHICPICYTFGMSIIVLRYVSIWIVATFLLNFRETLICPLCMEFSLYYAWLEHWQLHLCLKRSNSLFQRPLKKLRPDRHIHIWVGKFGNKLIIVTHFDPT